MNDETIRKRLIWLREQRDWTQKELAERLGVPPSQINRIESGQTKTISSDLLIALSREYGVTADYLLGLSNIRSNRHAEVDMLGLSENAARLLISRKVDAEIVSMLLEHKRFPELVRTIKIYLDAQMTADMVARNDLYDFAARALYGMADAPGIDRQDLAQDIHTIRAQRIDKHEMDKAHIHAVFMDMLNDIETQLNQNVKPKANPGFEVGRLAREEVMQMPRSEVTEEVIAQIVAEKMLALHTINEKQVPLVKRLLTLFLKARSAVERKIPAKKIRFKHSQDNRGKQCLWIARSTNLLVGQHPKPFDRT